MKRIGIVTITRNPNYGNSLQMIAMQSILRNMGYIPETIINYEGSTLFVDRLNIKHWIKVILNRNDARRIDVRGKRFRECLVSYVDFSKSYWHKSGICNFDPAYYDYCIVGSDQVWNPFFGLATDFEMLTFVPKWKRIAYAASIGVENFDGLDKTRSKRISESLKDFRAISVREDAGAEVVGKYTGENVLVCLDPTMLLTAEQWNTMIEKPELKLPQHYVAVYMLGNITDEYKKEIAYIANTHNAKIINLLDEAFFYLNPLEFAWIIKNSCFVCTDSFHATVFSILYHRQFKIFDRKDDHRNQNSRFKTLLKICGINDSTSIEWDVVEKNIARERVKSVCFLKKALEVQKA